MLKISFALFVTAYNVSNPTLTGTKFTTAVVTFKRIERRMISLTESAKKGTASKEFL